MKETAQAATLSRPKKIISALMSGVLVIGLAPMVHAPAQAYADDGANTFTVTETSIDLSTQGLNFSPTTGEKVNVNGSPTAVKDGFIAAVSGLKTSVETKKISKEDYAKEIAKLKAWAAALQNGNKSAKANWSPDSNFSPTSYANFSPSVFAQELAKDETFKAALSDLEKLEAGLESYSQTADDGDNNNNNNNNNNGGTGGNGNADNGNNNGGTGGNGNADNGNNNGGTADNGNNNGGTADNGSGAGGAAQQPTTTTPTTTDTATPAATTTDEGLAKGETATVGAATVKATGEDTVTYVAPKNKKAKKITVPATVTINGKTYKVTAIAAKAFKGSKATTVVLGKNIAKIGKNAFKGSKVKTVTLKTSKLKKASFKNMLKGSKIKTVKLKGVNKKTAKKYKKWAKAYGVKVK